MLPTSSSKLSSSLPCFLHHFLSFLLQPSFFIRRLLEKKNFFPRKSLSPLFIRSSICCLNDFGHQRKRFRSCRPLLTLFFSLSPPLSLSLFLVSSSSYSYSFSFFLHFLLSPFFFRSFLQYFFVSLLKITIWVLSTF